MKKLIKNSLYLLAGLYLTSCATSKSFEKLDDPFKWTAAKYLNCNTSDVVKLGKVYTHKNYVDNILYALSLKYPQHEEVYNNNVGKEKKDNAAEKILYNYASDFDFNFDYVININEINKGIEMNKKNKDLFF